MCFRTDERYAFRVEFFFRKRIQPFVFSQGAHVSNSDEYALNPIVFIATYGLLQYLMCRWNTALRRHMHFFKC